MYGVRLVCSFGTSYLRNHICSCFFTSLSLFRLSGSMIYNYFYVFFRLCFGNWFISNLFADISNGVEFVQWAYICWRIYKIAVNYILATHTESNRTRTHTFKIWLLTSAKRANNTASYGCFFGNIISSFWIFAVFDWLSDFYGIYKLVNLFKCVCCCYDTILSDIQWYEFHTEEMHYIFV